jgi:predicted nucleotidyltransferase
MGPGARTELRAADFAFEHGVCLATASRFREAYRMQDSITLDSGALDEFCLRWKVAGLSLFGSSVRADFGPASDVDVLVTFNPEAKWSLLDLVVMKGELSAMTGREVDLVEEAAIRNPFRRTRILQEKRVVYPT